MLTKVRMKMVNIIGTPDEDIQHFKHVVSFFFKMTKVEIIQFRGFRLSDLEKPVKTDIQYKNVALHVG